MTEKIKATARSAFPHPGCDIWPCSFDQANQIMVKAGRCIQRSREHGKSFVVKKLTSTPRHSRFCSPFLQNPAPVKPFRGSGPGGSTNPHTFPKRNRPENRDEGHREKYFAGIFHSRFRAAPASRGLSRARPCARPLRYCRHRLLNRALNSSRPFQAPRSPV
jgi:hypothetical protein